MHIDDFTATPERAVQYNENNDLMCKAAPRLRMYKDMKDDDPIPFFNPLLKNNTTGLVDVDPAVVMDKMRWSLPKDGLSRNRSLMPIKHLLLLDACSAGPHLTQS